MNKIIPMKDRNFLVTACGRCPFFEYDTMQGEYHKCIASDRAYPEESTIAKHCPLIDDTAFNQNLSEKYL